MAVQVAESVAVAFEQDGLEVGGGGPVWGGGDVVAQVLGQVGQGAGCRDQRLVAGRQGGADLEQQAGFGLGQAEDGAARVDAVEVPLADGAGEG